MAKKVPPRKKLDPDPDSTKQVKKIPVKKTAKAPPKRRISDPPGFSGGGLAIKIKK